MEYFVDDEREAEACGLVSYILVAHYHCTKNHGTFITFDK